jgi:hypothetical protein
MCARTADARMLTYHVFLDGGAHQISCKHGVAACACRAGTRGGLYLGSSARQAASTHVASISRARKLPRKCVDEAISRSMSNGLAPSIVRRSAFGKMAASSVVGAGQERIRTSVTQLFSSCLEARLAALKVAGLSRRATMLHIMPVSRVPRLIRCDHHRSSGLGIAEAMHKHEDHGKLTSTAAACLSVSNHVGECNSVERQHHLNPELAVW